jgi:hypothetical protein
MSGAAHDLSRKVLRLCRCCAQRKARFRYHGVVKADRDHTLCFECFRAERDRRRARLLAEVPRGRSSSPLARRPLTPRELDHRQRMLAHLGRRAFSESAGRELRHLRPDATG